MPRGVDVLVNNAELVTVGPAIGESVHGFRSVIDVNLHGSYWAAQACGRVMQPGSSIVNISSILGITNTGMPQAAYSASKAAIAGVTRDLAQQWGSRKGIRVNAIAPGFFTDAISWKYPEATSNNWKDACSSDEPANQKSWRVRWCGLHPRRAVTSPDRR
ncbi:hypothetical protein RW1_038_00580 [Rhodococcus wratislaviensis NBRC 100605]|uniref:Oxidoreductase n=1 Tax=Rhodococcus wratislaviensis NBRC 100605 TaxID=1219028 RepID=X0Q6X4_RHOWR|nr:hypothetical protein RW1_038_00580 [Rhodococcus wratislaviensis NBRC 100605]